MTCRRAQATLEYVLALAAMLLVIAVVGWVVAASVHAANRADGIVRSDYP